MIMFFDENLLLYNQTGKALYETVKELPIIDYHCHLDQKKIASNEPLADIGELWLSGDHYKWRAMRMCGVDEYYITGEADYHEKFLKYAEILPNLIGNPLYYWTHLELKQIFGIDQPLNKDSAEEIYALANAKLGGMRIQDLLAQFKVEFIATTDDPVDDLASHGCYNNVVVAEQAKAESLMKQLESYENQYKSYTEQMESKAAEMKSLQANNGINPSDYVLDKIYDMQKEINNLNRSRAEVGGKITETKEALKAYKITNQLN